MTVLDSAALAEAVRDPEHDPIPVLLQALNHPEETIRFEAIRYLSEMPTSRAVSALTTLLRDDSDDVRGEAAEALGIVGDSSATAALLTAITDPCAMVRLCVAEALGIVGHGDKRVAPALCCLLTDPDYSVRIFTLEALGDLGDVSILPALRTIRFVELPAVRVWVYYALARLGDESFALPETLLVLRRGGRIARTQAAKVLAHMATPTTAPRIRRALENALTNETSTGMRECLERWRDDVCCRSPTNRAVA